MDYGNHQFALMLTSELYAENECTYTVIHVPKQEVTKNTNKNKNYSFLFKIKGNCNVGIKLIHGIPFVFPGKYLTYRQIYNFDNAANDTLFINFVPYGNARLYRRIKASLHRKLNK